MNLTDVCRLLLYVHLVNKYSCPEDNIIATWQKEMDKLQELIHFLTRPAMAQG